LDLKALAAEICLRYRQEYPDELDRYGPAGNVWCVHDSQHMLNWGVETVNGYFDIKHEVAWLANVLSARSFPTDRLARSLDICGEVVTAAVPEPGAAELTAVLAGAAQFVRSGDFIHYSALDIDH